VQAQGETGQGEHRNGQGKAQKKGFKKLDQSTGKPGDKGEKERKRGEDWVYAW